jgi:predicted Zn-dependent protease
MSAKPKQPSIAELTQRMIEKRVASVDQVSESLVELHDGQSAFRTDPRTAWADATFALTYFGGQAPKQMPAEWAFQTNLAAASPAIPMAIGTFPQGLRDVAPLLNQTDYKELLPQQGAVLSSLVRPVGQVNSDCSQNERAAELWQSGKTKEALDVWNTMTASPVASFNLGMAKLFLGQPADAMDHLKNASEQLPENSGWKHLAKLYLALAQMKR